MSTKNFVVKNGITTGNITLDAASGNVTALNANLGNLVTANFFSGSGNNLSNIQGANVSGTVATATTAGTVTTNAQPNITSTGTLTALDVTGNVSGGNISTGGVINATGNITGNFFIGNGSQLTGIDATSIQNGNSNVKVYANANVTTSVAGVANVLVVTGTGSNIAGTLNATGDLTVANANLGNAATANFFIGSGANLTSLTGANVTGTVANATYAVSAGSAATAGTVTTAAQPNITSTGTLTGLVVGNVTDNVTFNTGGNGTLTATGNITALNFLGNVIGNISGNIVIPGSNTGVVFNDDGNANTSTAFTFNKTSNLVTVASNASIGNVSVGGVITVTGNANAGNLNTGGAVVATGNVTGGNLLTAGYLDVAGGIHAEGAYTGPATDGLVADYVHPDIRFSGYSNDGFKFYNSGPGNIELVSISSAGAIVANASITANANVTATANVITDNILGRTGAVTITSAGTNTNINLKPNGTGNIDANSAYITNLKDPTNNQDAATKYYVDNFATTGISYHQPVLVATTATLATATGGTMTYNNGASGVGANLVTTGTFLLIDGGNVQTVGTRILVKNETNAAWNGIYTYANTTTIVRSTDADEYGADSTTQLSINDYFFTTGGIVNEGAAFVVSAPAGTITFGTSNITFATFSTSQVYDAGTGLTLANTTFSISNTAVTTGSYGSADSVATFTVNQQGQLTAASNTVIQANAANLSGTVLKSSVVTSSLTSVGTLGNLTVTGNATVGNLISASGGGGNITGANLVSANYFTGTLTTAAQPNITSTGTLTSLAVSGTSNLNAVGNVTITGGSANQYLQTNGSGVLTWSTISSTSITNGNSNVTVVANANVNISSAGVANVLVVTSTGANIAGTLNATGNVTVGNLTTSGGTGGNITGANLVSANFFTGTLTTAAQPNVTSVGTLTSLAVTGNATAGNVTGANLVSANFFTGTLTTAAQPNITSTGTLTSLTVTGNATAGNVYANSGTIGASLLTGTITTAAQPNITSVGTLGNLTVTSNVTAGNLIGIHANGNSNVSIPAAAGNVNISVGGTANVLVVTSTGANIAGTANITGNLVANNVSVGTGSGGNISGANVVTANLFTGTISTNAQPNITSVGTLTSLAVTGNISAGNVSATTFTGALSGAATTAGTVTTNAQPNITSTGTLTSLAVTGNVTSGNVVTGNVALNGGLTSNRTNVSITTNTIIDQFNPSTYRTAKYIISASGTDGYQSVETLLVHNGIDSYITIYGSVCSNVTADIVELSSNINGVSGNVAVYATTASASTLVNIVATYIKT